MFLGTLRSGESIDITIHINHNIANDIKKNEYQNLHCLLIIQYFIYTNTNNTTSNNTNNTATSDNIPYAQYQYQGMVPEPDNFIANRLSSKGVLPIPPLNIQQQGQSQQQYTQHQQQQQQQQQQNTQQQQYISPSSYTSSLPSSKEQPFLLSPSYKGALTPRSSVKYTTTLDNNTTNSNTNTYTNTNPAHTSSNNNTNSITKSPQKIIDKITVTDPPLCNAPALPTDLSVSETLLYSVDKLIIPILYGICQVDGKSTS